jgi:hypothetical protein
MDAWWIGTVSTLAGAVTAATLQAGHDRLAYKRQLHTRWDEALLKGLVDYLATADRAIRALLRWREARNEALPDMGRLASQALSDFEALHEKSQVITLLTGDRQDAVRAAARKMREPLLDLRDEIVGAKRLDDTQVASLVAEHRDARTGLIQAAQQRLRVSIPTSQ